MHLLLLISLVLRHPLCKCHPHAHTFHKHIKHFLRYWSLWRCIAYRLIYAFLRIEKWNTGFDDHLSKACAFHYLCKRSPRQSKRSSEFICKWSQGLCIFRNIVKANGAALEMQMRIVLPEGRCHKKKKKKKEPVVCNMTLCQRSWLWYSLFWGIGDRKSPWTSKGTLFTFFNHLSFGGDSAWLHT